MNVSFHLGTNLYMVLNNTKTGYYQYLKKFEIFKKIENICQRIYEARHVGLLQQEEEHGGCLHR